MKVRLIIQLINNVKITEGTETDCLFDLVPFILSPSEHISCTMRVEKWGFEQNMPWTQTCLKLGMTRVVQVLNPPVIHCYFQMLLCRHPLTWRILESRVWRKGSASTMRLDYSLNTNEVHLTLLSSLWRWLISLEMSCKCATSLTSMSAYIIVWFHTRTKNHSTVCEERCLETTKLIILVYFQTV